MVGRRVCDGWRWFVCHLLFIPWFCHVGFAQDVTKLFLSGDSRYKMMGGNPFSSFSAQDIPSVEGDGESPPGVRFDYRLDDIYHEVRSDGTETFLQNTLRSFDCSLPLSGTVLHPIVGINVTSSRSAAIVDQSLSEHAQYEGERKVVTLSYAMSLGSSMRIRTALGQSYNDPQRSTSYQGTLAFKLPHESVLRVNIGSWGHSQAIRLQFAGINGILPLDYLQQGADVSLSFPMNGSTIIVQGKRAMLSPLPTFPQPADTRFFPTGTVDGVEGRVLIPLRQGWEFLLSASREIAEGRGSFYFQRQSYGALNRFGYENTSLQTALRSSFSSGGTFEADLKWQSLRGELEGHAEDWPFTSLFDSPVPIRENVQAEGSLTLWQFHLGGIMPLNERFRFGFGASCARILPQLELDSWESKFLVFGVRAYQQRKLPVSLIDAVILSGGFRWNVASLLLTYSVTQFMPFHIERPESPAGNSGDASVSPSFPGGSTSASGGQFHQATIAYEF